MTDQMKKLTPLMKAMARQMTKSLEAPQFQIETEVDCAKLIDYRNKLSFKPSYTSILTKLTADNLRNFPHLNASWGEDYLVLHEEVNIGIATDTQRGLLVPVIKNASNKTLLEIHHAMEDIKAKRELGKFSLEDLSGGTFTISNLGLFNVTSFHPVVNVPEVGILAISKIMDIPVVRSGQIVCGKSMRISLSVDHRVVDGAYCAHFMTELANSIQCL
jgi:pyruvate dehydrogenase E2 component (dihydrolipoamide acetyltransferase)